MHPDWFFEALRARQHHGLDDVYQLIVEHDSDIRAHVPVLRALAGESATVIELGVRHGVSTVALLAGRPRRLISVDFRRPRTLESIRDLVPSDTRWDFVLADSREFPRPPHDGLFVDTQHTASHLAAELAGRLPSAWIALHDTETFGDRGHDGGEGLNAAINRFRRRAPEWTETRYTGSHGLTVLRRGGGMLRRLGE